MTLLVHLGYLAFHSKENEVSIPNQEVADEFRNAVEYSGWEGVSAALKDSEDLKWDKSAKGAIDQIKDRKYPKAIEGYGGEILLVGISYSKKDKKHECVIEEYQK